METESSFPMAGAVRSRTLRWLAAASAMFMALSVLAAAPASADSAPTVPGTPTTVTADSLPTVQINGVVWDQVVVGNTVYATGSFTQARPAGAAAGTNETARSNILAYNITTGNLITTWAPSLNAQGRAPAGGSPTRPRRLRAPRGSPPRWGTRAGSVNPPRQDTPSWDVAVQR